MIKFCNHWSEKPNGGSKNVITFKSFAKNMYLFVRKDRFKHFII